MPQPDRFAALEARILELETQLAKSKPQPTELERLFPGTWRKHWSGPRSKGVERFIVQGSLLELVDTNAGINTVWNIDVLDTGDTIRLRQHHEIECPGFAECAITITRDGNGYVGFEVVNGETVRVRYEPISEPAAS
jgi:hypothetical protein